MFRTSLSIDTETAEVIQEAATAQNRTLAGQLRHLLKTHPEIIGWKIMRSRPEFQEALKSSLVSLGK